MLEMERIRVRILHENKPYDGVFNQQDDMILLSLFMRVITGHTPSLPSGTFGSAGVKPDFYLINSSADSHWPLKKWSALPDCIRQVCVSRDKSSASTNQEPDREGDAKANGEPVSSAQAVNDAKPAVKIVEEEKVALLAEEQEPEPTKDDAVDVVKKEEAEKPVDAAAEDESNEVTVEATVESKPETTAPEPEPAKEPEQPEPVKETEPVAQVEPEQQPEPVPEVVEEVKQEGPVQEPEPEPVVQAEPEPVKEAAPEPVKEPEPEPVKAEEPKVETAAAAPKPAAAPQQNNKKKGGNKKKGKKKK